MSPKPAEAALKVEGLAPDCLPERPVMNFENHRERHLAPAENMRDILPAIPDIAITKLGRTRKWRKKRKFRKEREERKRKGKGKEKTRKREME